MGRQALTSKESELARSNTISPGNPQGTPDIPRYSTSGFQKAAQQTPVLGPGSWFFREASPENIPNLSKMNQNNIELCKNYWVLMGRQALTSKESELARSPLQIC